MTLLEKTKSLLKEPLHQLQLIPVAAITLLKLTDDENTTITDLTNVIETEPALAVQLLKLINSAAYNRPAKITSIHRAVNLLGFVEVKQISLDLLFFHYLIKPKKNVQFDQLYYWQHCLFVAVLSRSIAISLKHPDPDAVYTAGLLHDIGKIVLETNGNVTYSDFLDFFQKSDNSIPENETIFFGITHAEIGQVLCEEWKIPASITAVVALHHSSFSNHPLASGYELNIAIVSFANFIAWMQGIGSVYGHHHPVLQTDVLTTLDIERLNIEEILDNVDHEMNIIQKFYDIDFPHLNKLRASLVKTTIKLSNIGAQNINEATRSEKEIAYFLSSLTAPHHNLNPDDFVPYTLEAIHNDFGFDRVEMLTINPKKRCLSVSYRWPENDLHSEPKLTEININDASADLLKCLRQREAVLITDNPLSDQDALKQNPVQEYFIVPVLRHNRFIGVLYADNAISQKKLDKSILSQMVPIANELGIALNNAKQLELEKKRSFTDALTNLNNRRRVSEFIENVYSSNIEQYDQIAIGFIDIDFFKKFNDDCGHQAGDDVLKIVADILRSLTRPGDCVGRYGGEEFVFIHLNTTVDGAKGYAERIRIEVERRGKILSRRLKCNALTVSIGVVMHTPQYKNHHQVIHAADKAMYQAKSEGRNRVVFKH